jgi:transcriptional regulator with XRE-family HTH domain
VKASELRAIRRRLGMTQAELAAELAKHPVTIAKYEAGLRPVSETAARLARRLVAEAALLMADSPSPDDAA